MPERENRQVHLVFSNIVVEPLLTFLLVEIIKYTAGIRSVDNPINRKL